MLKRLGCTLDNELRVSDICPLCVKEEVRSE